MMDLREVHTDGVTLLVAKWGSGVLRWDQGAVSRTVRNLVARGDRRIVLEVQGFPTYGSDVVSELVQCMAATARAGGDFRVRHPPDKLRLLLESAKLLDRLEESEGEGLADQ